MEQDNTTDAGVRPCPFCGSTHTERDAFGFGDRTGWYDFVRCATCQAQGPTARNDEAKAECLWNRRGPKPPAAGWRLGDPPGPGMRPYACNESGDGWTLFWSTPEAVSDGDGYGDGDHFITWPFGHDESAKRGDLSALGFLDPSDPPPPRTVTVRQDDRGVRVKFQAGLDIVVDAATAASRLLALHDGSPDLVFRIECNGAMEMIAAYLLDQRPDARVERFYATAVDRQEMAQDASPAGKPTYVGNGAMSDGSCAACLGKGSFGPETCGVCRGGGIARARPVDPPHAWHTWLERGVTVEQAIDFLRTLAPDTRLVVQHADPALHFEAIDCAAVYHGGMERADGDVHDEDFVVLGGRDSMAAKGMRVPARKGTDS